jgi:hypothetical protein
MSDEEVAIRAVTKAQRILEEYLEPRYHDNQELLDRLVEVLSQPSVIVSVERLRRSVTSEGRHELPMDGSWSGSVTLLATKDFPIPGPNLIESDAESAADRRKFLESCGNFVAITPPAITMVLSTSLNSTAISHSGIKGN